MEGLHFRKRETPKNPEEETEFLDEEGNLFELECMYVKAKIVIVKQRTRKVIT